MTGEESTDFHRPRDRSWRRAVLWTALFALLVTGVFSGWFSLYLLRPAAEGDTATAVVVIPRGASVRQISSLLGEAGLLDDDIRFVILTRLRGVADKLQAGEFALPTGKTPLELLDALVSARELQHAVTLPEGLRASEMAALLESAGWGEAARYLELVHDPEFISSLGLSGLNSLEGYLYPDTYYLTHSGFSERSLIETQVKRFTKVYGQLMAADGNAFDNRHEAVILASLIEMEATRPEERPLIASVFINRLERGMRLQSDPTAVYDLADFTGTITREELRRDSPYNTYRVTGLPLGPISNPGRASLHAALNPAETTYLYFVARNDGSHHFSHTYREHRQAIKKYLRKK